MRIDFNLPGTGFEAALFQGGSRSEVYLASPVQGPLTSSPVIVTGLTDGVDAFFGLAIRAAGGTTWTPVGTTVRTRPGAPVYVDASANPAVATGTTPATAFPNLQDGLLVAGAANGRNVWVRDGNYGAGPYALGPNVHAAGGFDGTFTLAARNAAATGTQLTGSTGQEIVSVQSGGSDGSLDGFLVDGGNTVLKGVDIVDSDVELRSLVVRRCADRGIKDVATTTPRILYVIACTITANASDGLSSAGPLDLRLDLSRFEANGQEGIDADDLQCPDNGAVSLVATGCRFYGNVFEGLDVDLSAAPLSVGTGTFDVRIENCSFELNGLDGLLIDQEHEFFPGFVAAIVVRGCSARANRHAGVHLDADANGTYRLERLSCTANATDGLLVTSETNAGEIMLLASWFAGNLGTGAHVASGNKVLLASHCVFAGNSGGALRGDVQTCAAANSIFLRQGTPLTTAIGAGNVTSDDSGLVFFNAPSAFTTATAVTEGTVTVTSTDGFAAGTNVVAADDGRRLFVNQVNGSTLVLDQAPQAFFTPGALTAYAGSNVALDLRLPPNSPALDAGIAAVGEDPPDAGPFGAAAGGVPGRIEPFAASTLSLASATPALATGVTALEPLVFTFDRDLEESTVTSDRVVVLRDGLPFAVNLAVSGRTLTLSPTTPGWSGALSVRLLGGLRATDDSHLAAPLLAPIHLR